ncbi:hypothetical protein CHS0354_038055 [Potamilus streckersoni]|uniref:Uncharacterized protein n=1 Tax=Potamilus streckersoni TaxID=2493646 RepID=A0AAE0W1M1_9BIVA|nr:hypothetical protein CHS0354_038055 [Potamilus streckersoni]
MFFKFNSLAGRLAQSSQFAAYSPQGLMPFSGSSPVPVFDSKTTKPALVHDVPEKPKTAQVRGAATANAQPHDLSRGIHPTNRGYLKHMEWQQVLCKQDGKLVWQKRSVDRVLFYLTVGLVIFGTAFVGYRTFMMTFPQKKKD